MGQLTTAVFQFFKVLENSGIARGPFARYQVNLDSLTPTELNVGDAAVDGEAEGLEN